VHRKFTERFDPFPFIVVGKEKGGQKDYLCSLKVIVLGSNIAAVT